MNELINFYKSVLESVDCKIDEDDIVNVLSPDGKMLSPQVINIEGKSLILKLPTTNVLRNGDWNEIAGFHPAAESIFSGQSEIINMLNTRINLKLYKSTLEMAVTIGAMAANKNIRKKLTLKQMELIGSIPEMTVAGMKYLQQVITKGTGIIGDRPLLNLHLNRGDTIDGIKFSRTCTLLTPILDEPDPFYKITSSGKSQLAVRALYEKVFPKVRSYGSNSKDIPYLESLLLCYYNAANHLNGLRKLLGKYKGETKDIQLDWFSNLDKVKSLSKKYIPQSLPGNTGVGSSDTEVIETKEKIVEPKKIPKIAIPKIATPDTTSPISTIRSGKVESTPIPVPTILAPPIQQAYTPVIQAPPVCHPPMDPAMLLQTGQAKPTQNIITPEMMMNNNAGMNARINPGQVYNNYNQGNVYIPPANYNPSRPMTRSDFSSNQYYR